MGAGTKDKMPLIIAARGTERWRDGEQGGGAGGGEVREEREEGVGKKKARGSGLQTRHSCCDR